MILTSAKSAADGRSPVIAFIPMCLGSALVQSHFEQHSTLVAMYADQRLDRNICGWTRPPSFGQSINPVFTTSTSRLEEASCLLRHPVFGGGSILAKSENGDRLQNETSENSC